jgi:hypothetical protein
LKLTFTVCNVCKDPQRQVTQYTITSGKQRVTVDLCEEDGKPLRKLMEFSASVEKTPAPKATATPKATPTSDATAAPRKRGRGIKVTDPDKIPRKS